MAKVIDATLRFFPKLAKRCGYMYLLEAFVAIPCCEIRTDRPADEHPTCDPEKCPVLLGKALYVRRKEVQNRCISTPST